MQSAIGLVTGRDDTSTTSTCKRGVATFAQVTSEHESRTMTKLHAIQMGPAVDLNRVRTSRHGSIELRNRTLRFVGNDGKQVSLTLDSAADMRALAEALQSVAGDVALTEVTVAVVGPEEFVSDRAFPENRSKDSSLPES